MRKITPAEDVLDNKTAILIRMAIGVTPYASVLKTIRHLRNGRVSAIRLRRIEFIWTCKDTAAFEWFHPLLSFLEDPTVREAAASPEISAQEFLRIHTYLPGLERSMQTTVGVYFCGPAAAGNYYNPFLSILGFSLL
jgi:hypothetical protein